jgi:hypothetical protein
MFLLYIIKLKTSCRVDISVRLRNEPAKIWPNNLVLKLKTYFVDLMP